MGKDFNPKRTSRSSLARKAKMPLLLPRAVEEGWSARRLAKEAGHRPLSEEDISSQAVDDSEEAVVAGRKAKVRTRPTPSSYARI